MTKFKSHLSKMQEKREQKKMREEREKLERLAYFGIQDLVKQMIRIND